MKNNKQNRTLRSLMYLFIIVVLLGLIGYVAFSNWYHNNTENPATDSEEIITLSVGEGESFSTILDDLADLKLIGDVNAVRLYMRVNNVEPNIKVGEYKIPNNIRLNELIDILEKGVTKNSFWVTIREGLRDDEIAKLLGEEFSKLNDKDVTFSSTEFQNIVNNPDTYEFSAEVESFLSKYKPAGKSLIGFLFPDTYNLETGASSLKVADTLLANFVLKIKNTGIDIDNINLTSIDNFYEALTLASIIEEESAGNDDRNLIASVFHNRLNADEAYLNYLQSDATVNYITKSDNPRSTIEDTQIDNPYNTYKYPGLPPTPVSNPGLQAIKATLQPTQSNYYFFRHDLQGKAYFNETYDQHLNSIYWYP